MLFTLQRKMPKLKKALAILIFMYITFAASIYFIQDSILFRPTVLEQKFEFKFLYPFEELFLKPNDKAVINALHFKNENPKGVILYFHGNSGDLSRWGVVTEYFVEKNYDVLVMDYRTYGKSTGEISENMLYQDAQFCYDYLKKQYNEKDITVYGRSLGTTFATYVAALNTPKQLILETPYYSITNVAQSRFWFLPTKYFLKYKFPTFKFINEVSCDILMLHGTKDKVIRINSAKKLREVAPDKQTTFITIQDGTHNNLIEYEEYHKAIKRILP